jgi:predicted ATPase
VFRLIIDQIECSVPGQVQDWWPFHIPAVRQIADEGLLFRKPLTFLVGENGSGKSTLLEAIAEAYGLDARGGRAGRKFVNDRPKTPLGEYLQLKGSDFPIYSGHRKGYFLRAETAHGFMSFVTGLPGYWTENVMEMSHGEGFLTVFDAMFKEKGLYLMDEPEAALSFSSCLRLIALMKRLVEDGAQIICATHSPLLTAISGAEILELDEDGIQAVEWNELVLVDHWRRFLGDPSFYLRHIWEEER